MKLKLKLKLKRKLKLKHQICTSILSQLNPAKRALGLMFVGVILLNGNFGKADFVPIGESNPAKNSGKTAASNSAATSAAPASPAEHEELQDLSLKTKPPELEKISGTVRIVRKGAYTEVFFKELSGVYTVAPTASHNVILQKLLDSQKTGKSVSFMVDPSSRQIVGTGETKSSGSGGSGQ